ncbi:hypothetical protein EJ05DRAFT_486397 [Pseudovirgaria hyperparasitica]|uniref:Uncharacterized protein n=1 Tax=Pseudovirgaria hyperparasitica TaxID=470096 RepID=A0A6A6W3Z2_9PEZI|nr:uncharacterized protein EJ05DRAFT_486397 [Pseudovirgaria hyperparasitica]KAF2757333.1 hypothetical protein EJ05DRAFT_486397 [Pseudovirgaria hyperparasitica]
MTILWCHSGVSEVELRRQCSNFGTYNLNPWRILLYAQYGSLDSEDAESVNDFHDAEDALMEDVLVPKIVITDEEGNQTQSSETPTESPMHAHDPELETAIRLNDSETYPQWPINADSDWAWSDIPDATPPVQMDDMNWRQLRNTRVVLNIMFEVACRRNLLGGVAMLPVDYWQIPEKNRTKLWVIKGKQQMANESDRHKCAVPSEMDPVYGFKNDDGGISAANSLKSTRYVCLY